MATAVRDTITLEEFDKHFDESNERLRQELAITQERVQRLEALLARKEASSTNLEEVLTEIKREEDEIAPWKLDCALHALPSDNPVPHCKHPHDFCRSL